MALSNLTTTRDGSALNHFGSRIQIAARWLGASLTPAGGEYVYYADEIRRHVAIDLDAAEKLADMLDACENDADVRANDTYSTWCGATTSEELEDSDPRI